LAQTLPELDVTAFAEVIMQRSKQHSGVTRQGGQPSDTRFRSRGRETDAQHPPDANDPEKPISAASDRSDRPEKQPKRSGEHSKPAR
jgi:hypothetical protein